MSPFTVEITLFNFVIDQSEADEFKEWVRHHKGSILMTMDYTETVKLSGRVVAASKWTKGTVMFSTQADAMMFKLKWHEVIPKDEEE